MSENTISKAKLNNAIRNFLATSDHFATQMEAATTQELRTAHRRSMEAYAQGLANRYGITAEFLAAAAAEYEARLTA